MDTRSGGQLINAGTLINTSDPNQPGSPPGVLTNAGTLINTGTISGTGTFLQTAGQTINNGSLSQASVTIQGGSLSGTGSITAPLTTLSSGALLSPGTATTLGTLTINGNLQSSGDMLFRIGGLGTGQFDVLAIHGMAFLNGGTISFNFLDFTPKAGNSWRFLLADAISGWETLSFNFSGLSSDLGYQFTYSNGAETLRIHAVPEPSSLVLLASGLGGLAFSRRRTRG